MSDTIPVTVTVLRIARADAGRLLALADIEMVVDGLAILLHGVRITRTGGPGSIGVGMPALRGPTGTLTPVITLPPELARAVYNVVIDEFAALARQPFASSACYSNNRPGS